MRPSSSRRTSTIKSEPVSPRSSGPSSGPGTYRAETDMPALAKLKELGFKPSLIKTVKQFGNNAFFSGGNADLFLGSMDNDERTFVVKRIRTQQTSPPKLDEKFARELQRGTELNHPNILPLIGVCIWDGCNYPCFISEWMQKGESGKYLLKNLQVDPINFLIQVANGLNYLHEENFTHGDLKGANILVNSKGEAVLSDFGHSKKLTDGKHISDEDGDGSGSVNWMARELLLPPQGTPIHYTKESDIWAMGMTIQELWSGKIPYHELFPPCVQTAICNKELPTFNSCYRSDYSHLDNDIQRLCNSCCNLEPSERPSAEAVRIILRQIHDSNTVPKVEDAESIYNSTETTSSDEKEVDGGLADESGSESSEHTEARTPTPTGERPTPRVEIIEEQELPELLGIQSASDLLGSERDAILPPPPMPGPRIIPSVNSQGEFQSEPKLPKGVTRTSNIASLNSVIQKEGYNLVYVDIFAGKSHIPIWKVIVKVDGTEIAQATGEAGEQKATVKDRVAGLALEQLRNRGVRTHDVHSGEFANCFRNWLNANRIHYTWDEASRGLSHSLEWTCTLIWDETECGRGTAKSKKQARTDALIQAASHPLFRDMRCPQRDT